MGAELILAGDIGGTKTNLALFAADAPPGAPLTVASFRSADHPSLSAIITQFLAREKALVRRAAFGVAGPVAAGKATATNLHWRIDRDQLCATHSFQQVVLVNDLVATATAVPLLGPADLHPIRPGLPEPGGPIAVIAPGTGLGEAFLLWDGQHYRAHASEGGHADFAPDTPQEMRLLAFLQPELGHVSYEAICSGLGIPNLYRFLKQEGAAEPDWLRTRLAAAADPTPVIMDTALNQTESAPICQDTLRLFVKILGAEAGNLALKIMATGGVYLAGGIPPRILTALETGLPAPFTNKGRLSHVLQKIPVQVIVNPDAPLLGAATLARQMETTP